MTTSSNIAQELLRSSTEKGNTTMTDEYNITDEEINATIAKMEDQFIKLEKFLDDKKPENKLKDINKQLKQPISKKKLPSNQKNATNNSQTFSKN